MDMHHHSLAVDVGDLQIQGFLQSQSERVDDCEEAAHGGLFDQLEQRMNFPDGDDHRQFLLDLDASQLEYLPIAWAGDAEVELERLQCDVDGTGAPASFFGNEQEILSQLILGGLIRIVVENLHEFPQRPAVGLECPRRLAAELQILGCLASGTKENHHEATALLNGRPSAG
jgi:hypothetical protein